MKILVYGAGNIGSLYAALLQEAGQEVSLLVRGEHLADVRAHGIKLEDTASGTLSQVAVHVVERLDADDQYNLVLVVLPNHRVSDALPILSANGRTPNIMFFGNNASGPQMMTEVLDSDRVLLGFPGAAAVRRGDRIRYLILSAWEQPTTIGELDGKATPRLEAISNAFQAAGFPTSMCANVDAWLKTHAAEILATAGALYSCSGHANRLSKDRDALKLMLSAIREGYRILSASGIPITPRSHRIFNWLPEPLLLLLMKRRLESESADIKVGHASNARGEMQMLSDEFRALADEAKVPIPATERLREHIRTQL